MKKLYDKFLELRAAMRARVHALHAKGVGTTEIARDIGMSSQRVHQILYPHGKPVDAKKANGKKKPNSGNGSAASALARASWANMTPEQRSERQRRASAAAAANRKAKREAAKQ